MTPSPVTSQAATTQSGSHTRGSSTPQTPANHSTHKAAVDRSQHAAGLGQVPSVSSSGNADSIAADLAHDNLPDEFNFDGVLDGDHGGGSDGVEGALDVSFDP